MDKDVPSQRMKTRQTSLSLFSLLPGVTLGSPVCLLCDRVTDARAVWDAGVLLSAADWAGAPSGVAGRGLSEAEWVSGRGPGLGAVGCGWGDSPAPSP